MKSKGLIISIVVISIMLLPALVMPSFAQNQGINNSTNNQKTEENTEQEELFSQVTLHKDNWFDFVNEYWEKYTTKATVIDCQTGKSYVVKRVGGYNHADVEPINSSNTSIMKSIYNNTWQWTRRPVWVEIKGRYIAGSINGMPHAYDYIEGNDMIGHTCIHFYKSRTHGSDNWDPAHREAVETAFARSDLLNDYIKNKN